MLDASKDKVILFVELKGETADEQMADDAVRIIKEKGMQDQAVLISLKLDVLEYIEQKYPEMQTGYLAFISFGQIEDTPFDYLALEEEIATDDTIAAIAAAAGFSPNHLSKRFRETAGIGVHEYLVFVRLQHAALELITTGDTITQIALRCGFSDSNYFKDVFKKKYGMTPRDYRKARKQQ